MKRALRWAVALAALGLVGLLAALLASDPPPPPGPEPGRSLFQAHCATCHGSDGRGGAWRARFLLLRPGNLADPQTATLSDQYLLDVIRHGGATFGKPGMPSFGFTLSDEEIRALVAYVRALPRTPAAGR
ncbi:MAG: c-type cytochrome [Candidatus Rokuibacteriota bacterium]